VSDEEEEESLDDDGPDGAVLSPDDLGRLNPFGRAGSELANAEVEDGTLEAHLADIMGLVLHMQTDVVQTLAAAALSTQPSAEFDDAAAKKAVEYRKQIAIASKRLIGISRVLSDERKRRGFPSVPRPVAMPPAPGRLPNKRGRGRLQKCEKHRRWKKRCPPECPEKPIAQAFLDDMDFDNPSDEDSPKAAPGMPPPQVAPDAVAMLPMAQAALMPK
jgi:hypothetical protein